MIMSNHFSTQFPHRPQTGPWPGRATVNLLGDAVQLRLDLCEGMRLAGLLNPSGAANINPSVNVFVLAFF